MRNLNEAPFPEMRDRELERQLAGQEGDAGNGAFRVRHAGRIFRVIASNGMGWDHISVSLPGRCPTWDKMEYMKRLFFDYHEVAMQLHVPPDQHICHHPFCLHIWRPHDVEIPRPPQIMV